MAENSMLRTLRELSAPSVVGAFTGLRIGLAWAESWAQGAPELTRLGMEMWDPMRDPDEVAWTYRRKFLNTYERSVRAALDEVDEGTGQVRGYVPAPAPKRRKAAPAKRRTPPAEARAAASRAPAKPARKATAVARAGAKTRPTATKRRRAAA